MVRRKLWVQSDQLEFNSQGEVEVGCLHKIIDFCCFCLSMSRSVDMLNCKLKLIPFPSTSQLYGTYPVRPCIEMWKP